jgi:hypothetical protein
MKFSEADEGRKEHAIAYVRRNSDWLKSDFVETKDRICGYLFGLNAGGLVAAAAAIKELGTNRLFRLAVGLFAFGLIAEVVRATFDYFSSNSMAKKHRDDADKLFSDELSIEEFFGRRGPGSGDMRYHILGFVSGATFAIGLTVGLIGALYCSTPVH